jgi:hypothetical protein
MDFKARVLHARDAVLAANLAAALDARGLADVGLVLGAAA